MAWSYSHRHTGGVCSVQGACHATSWSANADTKAGASMSMGASGSASGSVDAGMLDDGVGIAIRGCDYDTYAYKGTSARCGMARGTRARKCKHGHERDMERSKGGLGMSSQCQCHDRGMGSWSRHANARRNDQGRPHSVPCAQRKKCQHERNTRGYGVDNFAAD
ncbi:hypothetical protein SLEP1_g31534 [Rubroshorea leprosula]|uniref:Uncharacterized protein n=1 Tax=Rubroshorea leprosula TaxID=152421 RepID=A0AAV5K3M5_9ROSI|nr:hypothetical protein SLEP1_g31534 [Rubroshorea leprosula]